MMPSTSRQGSFIQSVSVAAAAIPKPIACLGLAAGFFSPAFDLAAWVSGIMPLTLIIVSVVCAVCVWSFVEYLIVFRMMDGGRPSLRGWGWFAAGTAAIFLPIFGGFGVFYFLRGKLETGASPLFLVFLIISAASVALLPAWPVCLMRRQSFVSPIRVLRATKGHRWGLIGMALVGGGVHKIIPAIGTASNLGNALLFFLGKGLVNGGFNILTACISATAWMYAYRNDHRLLED